MRGPAPPPELRTWLQRRVFGLGGLGVLALFTLCTGGVAWAGFGGAVAGSPGTFSSGTMLLTGVTPGGVSCTSSSTAAPISSNDATCRETPSRWGR